MKYFFLSVLSLLLFSSYSQKNNNDKPMENFKPLWSQNYVLQNIKPSQYQIPAFFERLSNLKGKIRRIEQKEFECKEDGKYVLIEGFLTFHILFNEENEIISELSNEGKPLVVYKSYLERQTLEEKWLDSNGNVTSKIENVYDELGLLRTKIKYGNNGNKVIENFDIQVLDENNFIYHGDELDSYFKDKKLIKILPTSEGLYVKTFIEYIGNRKIVKNFFKDILSNQQTYEDDYLVSYIICNNDGSIEHEYIKVYDSKKNFIEGIMKREKDVHGFTERKDLYIYDDNNLFIEEKILMQDGLFHSRYTNDYDHLGNIIRNGYNGHVCDYKYDSNDNWIEKVEFKRSILVTKTIRNIEYF